MTEDEDEKREPRVEELEQELQEVLDGEKILTGLYAMERVVVGIVTNHCVSKEAAIEVVDTMHKNMKSYIEAFDGFGITAWSNKDTLN